MSSHNQKSFPADTNTNSTTITTAFELGTEELYALITSGSSLAAYGGVGGIAAKLHSSLLSGLVCQRLTTTTSTTEDLHHQSVSVPPSAPPLPLPVSTSTTSLTGGGGDEEPMEGPSLSSSAFSKQHQQLLPQDYADRIAKYGTNTLPAPVSFSFLHFCWEAIQDRTLILLLVAAAVEVAYGIYVAVSSRQNASLIDGFAVVFAGKKFDTIVF